MNHNDSNPTEMVRGAFAKKLASFEENCQHRKMNGPTIAAVTSYAMASGGKLVRPTFCLLACGAQGGNPLLALDSALAIEMVHTYSLVHDDLPAMDNDSERRGRASTHIAFGDGPAIMAGDALLTDAFAVLAGSEVLTSQNRVRSVAELAGAAGGEGMVEGQFLDMDWLRESPSNLDHIERIHRLKTGRLIGAAFALGAIAASAHPADIANWRLVGEDLGMAFQAIDDAKDNSKGALELSILRCMSVEDARDRAHKWTEMAFTRMNSLVNNSIYGNALKEMGLALVDR